MEPKKRYARGIAVLLSAAIVVILNGSEACCRQFHVLAHFKDANTCSVEQLKEMGTDAVWFNSGLPVKIDASGAASWASEEARRKVEATLAYFEGSGISVIPLTNTFYENTAGSGQVSRFSDKPKYRCFSADTTELQTRLRFFVRELSRFKSFSGICMDDESGNPAGGCICDRCRKLFLDKYHMDIPGDADFRHVAGAVVPDSHPILLWTQFQQEQIKNYYTGLLAAVRQESATLPLYNIPAAAYYSGKQLTIPDCTPRAFNGKGRYVTLDACHIRDYQMYVQFYFAEITPSGWKEKVADGLCIAMTPGGVPNFPNVPVYDTYPAVPDSKAKVISVPAFRRFILQTFSEGAKGIVYYPWNSLTPEHKKAAMEAFAQSIKPICDQVGDLHRPKGKVAVYYSDTTRALADVWRDNPIERYKHLHQCDALAYYLLRKGIPFEMVMEDEITRPEDLQRFEVVISAGIDHLKQSSAGLLAAYTKKGGRLILDKGSAVNIPGMQKLNLDAGSWYAAVVDGSQRPSDLEYQAGLLDSVLSGQLNGLSLCRSSSRSLNVNYLTDGRYIYLFIVNDDPDAAIQSELLLDRSYRVFDVLNGQDLGVTDRLRVAVDGLRVLKLALQ